MRAPTFWGGPKGKTTKVRNNSIGTKIDGPMFARFQERARRDNCSNNQLVFEAVETYLNSGAPNPGEKPVGDDSITSDVNGRISRLSSKIDNVANSQQILANRFQKLHEQLLTEIYKNRLLCTEILRHVNPNALAALTAEFDDYDRAKTGAERAEKTQKTSPRLNGAKTPNAPIAPEKSVAQDALQFLDHDDVEEEMAR